MNTRFCASCGMGTQYTAVKPTFCSKCGKGFEAAFATLSVQPAPQAPQYLPPVQQPYHPPQSHRRFVGARGREVGNPFVNQPQEAPVQYQGGEDYVDRDAMYDAAQALASTINESDFVCGVEGDGTHHGRLAPAAGTHHIPTPKITRRKKTS